MNNNARKQDHLWDKEDLKKNVLPCTIMHQNAIIYETQKILSKKNFNRNNASKHDYLWDTEDFKKNVRPCAIMHENAIIYETEKNLRKMNVHVV